MNDEVEKATPCIRGCTWENLIEGEAPRPRPARHGVLCKSCFDRLEHALSLIPDLMANMRLKITPAGVANYESERVQGGNNEVPAPLRIDPLDASDSLFAKLVSWTEVFGGLLKQPQPSVAVWMNLREAQGSRPVSPDTAHKLASQLTGWFEVRLTQVADTAIAGEFHDDLCTGWEDAPGVFRLNGRYGTEPRPVRAADKRDCPVCGKREVFAKPPDSFDPEWAVICGRCKWVAEPHLYEHYAKLFKDA